MSNKLRAAAEETVKKLEHISRKLEGHRVWGGMKWEYHAILPSQYLPLRDFVDSQIRALRQALNQLPDPTKMIDTGIDRGAWSDVPDATKWVDELRGDEPEPFGWLFKQADGDLYKLLRGEDAKWHEKNNPSWIKVSPLYTAPPKTEFECPRCGHCCWTPDDMAPRKRTVWVNLYSVIQDEVFSTYAYKTREEADYNAPSKRIGNRAWPLEIEE